MLCSAQRSTLAASTFLDLVQRLGVLQREDALRVALQKQLTPLFAVKPHAAKKPDAVGNVVGKSRDNILWGPFARLHSEARSKLLDGLYYLQPLSADFLGALILCATHKTDEAGLVMIMRAVEYGVLDRNVGLYVSFVLSLLCKADAMKAGHASTFARMAATALRSHVDRPQDTISLLLEKCCKNRTEQGECLPPAITHALTAMYEVACCADGGGGVGVGEGEGEGDCDAASALVAASLLQAKPCNECKDTAETKYSIKRSATARAACAECAMRVLRSRQSLFLPVVLKLRGYLRGEGIAFKGLIMHPPSDHAHQGSRILAVIPILYRILKAGGHALREEGWRDAIKSVAELLDASYGLQPTGLEMEYAYIMATVRVLV